MQAKPTMERVGKERKKRNPPQLNRPVNGRREPIIISFSRFKMSSFDLMLVHADCYIIGYLHVRIPYESLWWWEICMGTLLAIRSAVSSRPSRRAVSELVGNDKQQPNVWSEGFYLEKKKNPTFVRRKKKYLKKNQQNDKCFHHLHKTTVRTFPLAASRLNTFSLSF